jgi:hypothetical protein
LRNCWPFTSFIVGWLSHVHIFVMPHLLLDL